MKQIIYIIDKFDRIKQWYGEMKYDVFNTSGTTTDIIILMIIISDIFLQ